MDAAKEYAPILLREHRAMLGWQQEPASCRVMGKVTSGRKRAKPFARIALDSACARSQFGAGRRAMCGQVLEEPEAVADVCEHGDAHAARVGQDSLGERFGLLFVKGAPCCHRKS